MLRGGVSVVTLRHLEPPHTSEGDFAAMELAELVHAAGEGDQEAWNAIVERFGGLVWATVRAHRLSAADGAEVVQTTWLRLVEHLDRIRDPERLGGWLASTARNECLRQIRLGAREVPSDDMADVRARRRPRPRSQPPEGRARPGVLDGVHRAGRALPGAAPGADG